MREIYLRLIGTPIIAFFATMYFGHIGWDSLGDMALNDYLYSLVITSIFWEGNRQIYFALRRRFPGYYNTKKRLLRQAILSSIFNLLVDVGIIYLSRFIPFCEHAQDDPILAKFTFTILSTAFFISIYESMYFLGEWKKNIQQTEALARSHIQSQFEALKKQLDPHFLFNSLNTLASLIDVKNEPAQGYLEKLSDVYRYVLDTREKSTVSLEEEMKFLEAYLHLIKVRFRENVQIDQDISTEVYRKHIPALSLQLLVENAIKHNEISLEYPLNIRIFEENGQLTVSNNKRVKKTFGASTRVGLQNIINRYKLLNAAPVEIIDAEHTFTVRLPLLSVHSV